MFKKITGVSEETIRDHMRAAKLEYKSIFTRVEESKRQFYELQRQNDIERAELQREEKIAAKMKFKKMDKKLPFLPSLHTRGFL
jgi:hypothetical protein